MLLVTFFFKKVYDVLMHVYMTRRNTADCILEGSTPNTVASLGVSKGGGGANQTEGCHGGVALTNKLGMQKFISQIIWQIN